MEVIIKRASGKRKARKNRRGRGPRYWILTTGVAGAIVAFTIGNARAMHVAYARAENGSLVISKNIDGEMEKFDFKIAPGRLEDVIKEFEKETGLTVTADNSSILDIHSSGVVGRFTADQALLLILKDTGVSFSVIDSKNFKLVLQAQAATVNIESNAEAVSSPKYTSPMRDIPQTISVIAKDQIEQQGATTLRDVLNNVPGITMTAGEGGTPAGDNLNIRGFSARNDIYVDGVRDLGSQSRDAFNLEQVEVVKGPSSSFTGRGSTGGTVNLVSKLPNLRRTYAGEFSLGSSSRKRATVDVNLPFGNTIAVRLNAMADDGDFPGREYVSNKRYGLAPSVIFGLGTSTRFSLSYYLINEHNTPDYGIPYVPATNNVWAAYRNTPAPVPRDTYYGMLSRDYEHLRSDLFTARFEKDFNDNLQLRNQFRTGYDRRNSVAAAPRFDGDNLATVHREYKAWRTHENIFDDQLDLTSLFKTGKIGHSLVFGGSYSHEIAGRTLVSGPNTPNGTPLFNPNPYDVYTGTITVTGLEPKLTSNTVAGYVFDTVKLGERVQLVGGLRYDVFDTKGNNVTGSGASAVFVPLVRNDKILSGRAAFIYKPVDTGSFYVSFGTSANPSLEGLLYSPASVSLDPEKTKNYEAGTKWELLERRLLLSGAFFLTDKANARTTDPVTGLISLDGNVRVDGIELSATGNFTRDWQIFAGYTFLKSEVVESKNFSTVNGVKIYEQGKELINTPNNSFNLWTTYHIGRFLFGGGPRFIGERFGDNINTRLIKSYWSADAMGSFRINKNIDARVNLYNITDTFYFDKLSGGHVVPGAGRSVLASLGFHF